MKFVTVLLTAILCSSIGNAAIAPVAIDSYGKNLVIAGHDSRKLDLFDPGSGKVKSSIDLKARPNGLLVKDDMAYICTGSVHGKVQIIDLKHGKQVAEIAVGHTPMNPFISGGLLYVSNRFDNNVAVIDLSKRQIVKQLDASREPIGAVASADGKHVWIANHLPAGPSDGDFTACDLTCYDGGTKTQIPLSNGTQGVRGITISPDGKYVVLTHILSRYHLPTTQLDRGWMNTNAITIVNTGKPAEYKTILLDDTDLGAANPWAAVFSADGGKLVVSHAGAHEVSIFDFPRLLEKMEQSQDAVNELGFVNGVRERVLLPLNGPRSLVIKDGKAYCAGYYSDNLVSVSLKDDSPEIAAWMLGDHSASDEKRMGEMYFNDASLCFQTWQSCATCHPDSRVDGLNWDLMNDGMGNPKNTRSMLMSHRTPPVMTLGIRKDAETAVNAGFHHIQFVDVDEKVLHAVNAYLRDMQQVASPVLRRDVAEKVEIKKPECLQCHAPEIQRGVLTDAAKRGKAVFKASGCIECHPHPYYTTKVLYDFGTLKGLDEGKKVVVPTLVEVWRTAPYFHDGRTNSLKEVITIHNKDDKRGKTSHLKENEVNDLVEYVKSL